MAVPARKATFSLQPDVLAAVDEAVASGSAPSKNAFVERALRKELREVRRQLRRAQWEEAFRDPLFIRDLQEVAEAFASSDAETLSEPQ
ncbi:MAG TPA: ribbon-helix-helix protein, CopG family [Chloroflexota bacterium]|jgi:Arc/MetJ-type ribon-helix-helix transcriptional regulator